MSNSTVNFSKKEMAFVHDKEFLLTKMEIGKKIELLLGLVEQKLHQGIDNYQFPTDVRTKSGKISKGDNYQNLPYFVLDYPRTFGREGIFAFRTMFWWGNCFSATLHLAGKYLDPHRRNLVSNIKNIQSSDAYLCVNKIPWEYHYLKENYLPAADLSEEELMAMFNTKSFIKISFKLELEEYLNLPDHVLSKFHDVLAWI